MDMTANAAATARVAAWDVIANTELPAGTKVTVEDGWVSIHPRGGQPARVPYGPTDTREGLYDTLRAAAQATAKAGR